MRPSSVSCALLALLLASLLAAVAPAVAQATDLGVQVHALHTGMTQGRIDAQLDRAKANHSRIVRVDVGWASLQPDRRGDWRPDRLARLDAVVGAANARGLDLVLTLADTPCWASSAPARSRKNCRGAWWNRDVAQFLPRRTADYADALAFLADRYGTRVRAWEMWNEPNLDDFLRGRDKARRYTRLVQAAYARAKPAAPQATFVAGVLSEADTGFAQQLYDAGIKGSYDAFSIHPYSQDASPLAARARMARQSFVSGVPDVRDVMRRNGDDSPLWLTEFGWTTSTRRGSQPWRNGVGEARQARYVADAIGQLPRWDYVPVAIYYKLADDPGAPTATVPHYGLTRVSGRAKPALRAFARSALRLYAGG